MASLCRDPDGHAFNVAEMKGFNAEAVKNQAALLTAVQQFLKNRTPVGRAARPNNSVIPFPPKQGLLRLSDFNATLQVGPPHQPALRRMNLHARKRRITRKASAMNLPGPQPNQEELEAFKELFLKKFGVSLSDEEALDLGLSVVTYVHATIRPVRKKIR